MSGSCGAVVGLYFYSISTRAILPGSGAGRLRIGDARATSRSSTARVGATAGAATRLVSTRFTSSGWRWGGGFDMAPCRTPSSAVALSLTRGDGSWRSRSGRLSAGLLSTLSSIIIIVPRSSLPPYFLSPEGAHFQSLSQIVHAQVSISAPRRRRGARVNRSRRAGSRLSERVFWAAAYLVGPVKCCWPVY